MNPQNLILIIANSDVQVNELSAKVTREGLYQIAGHRLNQLSPQIFEEQKYQAAVFDFDLLNQIEVIFLKGIAERNPETPLVILSQQISIYAFRSVAQLQNMIILQKPYHVGVLPSVLEKIITMKLEKQTRSPRFLTDEPVRLIVLRNGLFVPTKMKNYSASGAFLEYRGISLKVGDKIQVSLGDIATSGHTDRFQLQAKVIWIHQGDGPRSASRGVGIQFL